MTLARAARSALCSASPAHVVAVMTLIAAGGALADDLPGSLLAAAKIAPTAAEGAPRCYALGDLGGGPRLPYSMGDHRTGVAATADYSSTTAAAYLGAVPRGAQPSALVQALEEAGVARRIPLTWLQHTLPPGSHVPPQRDLGVDGRDSRPTPSEERTESAEGDAFLVAGQDRDAFAHADPGATSGSPPALDGSGPGPDFSRDAQRPPPGVWQPNRMCFRYSPVRVLEYGDPERQPNGVMTVSAAVLFEAEGMPAWARTYRVAAGLPQNPLPWEVRYLSFRDDGDGWRPEPFGSDLFLRGHTHVVRDDGG